MRFDPFGQSEGSELGPAPGEGADIHFGPDVEGTAPDELPPRPHVLPEEKTSPRAVRQSADS